MNVPPKIGLAMRKESLAVLSRDYGLEDLEDLLEVIMIDAHNERIMRKAD